MLRVPVVVAFACLAIACPIRSQTTKPKATAPDLAAEIAPIFADYAKPGSPGCAVMVLKNAKVAYEAGFGTAHLEHGIPIGPDTVFDIGSTSKQFTAALIVLLALDGKLSLDDDIHKHIPEFPDYKAPITIRNLLHHTSGIRDYLPLLDFAGQSTENWTTNADALAILLKQKKLCFAPGTKHEYSNSGYMLLSLIAERAAKKPFAELGQEKIFGPLGMTDTHIHDDHRRIVARRAQAYSATGPGAYGIEMSDFEQTGDGAVMTTVRDLAKWDENFTSGKVGGPKFLEIMNGRGALANGRAIDYGFGLVHTKLSGIPMVSHGGAWAGYRAEMLRFPTKETSVVLLSNLGQSNPSALARAVAGVVLKIKSRPTMAGATSAPAYVPSAAEMAAQAGDYLSLADGRSGAVVVEGAKLQFKGRASTMPLVPIAAGKYRVDENGIEMSFLPADAKSPKKRLNMRVPGGQTISFVEYEPWTPTPAELAACEGSYRSEEAGGAVFTVVVKDGAMALVGKNVPDAKARPLVKDAFNYQGILIKFRRRADGSVAGMTVTMRGLTDLVFTKQPMKK